MTFTGEEIKSIDINDGYEWMYPEVDNECEFVLDVYDDLRERACAFLDVSYEDVILNGWVDVYGYIDCKERVVTRILFNIVPCVEEIPQRELDIRLNHYEGKLLYRQLIKTPGVTEFLDDAEKELEEE